MLVIQVPIYTNNGDLDNCHLMLEGSRPALLCINPSLFAHLRFPQCHILATVDVVTAQEELAAVSHLLQLPQHCILAAAGVIIAQNVCVDLPFLLQHGAAPVLATVGVVTAQDAPTPVLPKPGLPTSAEQEGPLARSLFEVVSNSMLCFFTA